MGPGGVFAQWLQLYSLTPETLRTLVATFAAVFPETVVFQTSGVDLVLVGSVEPIAADSEHLAGRLRDPSVAVDLGRIGVLGVRDLLARLVLDVDDVAGFSAGARLNTEDNARVEFQAPWALYLDTIRDNVEALVTARRGTGPDSRGGVREARCPAEDEPDMRLRVTASEGVGQPRARPCLRPRTPGW
jgi:spermidine synthase